MRAPNAATLKRTITQASTSAPEAAAKTLNADEDELDGTEARPGPLETSSTAVPCDLSKNGGRLDVVRDGIRAGLGVLTGMRGSARAGSKARLQLTLTTSTLTRSAARRSRPHVDLWARRQVGAGSWPLPPAEGRHGRARRAAWVGTAGGLVVHGGAGGAATARDQARGAAGGRGSTLAIALRDGFAC